MNLGLTEGGHEVWVGLRGHADAPAAAVWQGVRLHLDDTPPLLVITNPTAMTVSQPVIQLQGYASEPLSRLTYDLTNAAGLVTNQTANLIGQYADTNTWTFTTNYFQAYDVTLTNGANVITLHAVDLAGNQTTLTTTLILDYSGATNPPAITVNWPPSNHAVAGTSFTLQGWLDDDTATVTVSGLGTNQVTGLVERGGRFTVPNLPLSAGTNMLTIAATNAAGYGRTLTWTVMPSPVTVTMDAISAAALAQEFVMVTGTISDPNHDVYVNGVPATVSGDPTWEADDVPVISDSGRGTLDIEIYPAGSDPATTPPAGSWQAVVSLPPVVQAVSYVENIVDNDTAYTCRGTGTYFRNQNVQWNQNTGGTSTSSMGCSTCGTENTIAYWPGYWPDGQDADGHALVAGLTDGYSQTTPSVWQNVAQAIQGAVTPVRCGTAARQMVRNSSTVVQVVAGGPAQPGAGSQLIHLLVSAAGYSDTGLGGTVGVYDNDAIYPGFTEPGDFPVLAGAIQVPGQIVKPTATNAYVGETYLVLPAGAAQTLPVQVTDSNRNAYSFDVQPENGLRIYDGNSGTDLTLQTNTVIVGQPMNLICQTITTNGPTLTSFQWSVPGNTFSDYVATAESAVLYTNFPTTHSNAIFYWTDGASNRVVQCSAAVQGKTVTAQATFNVLRPTGQIITEGGSVALGNYQSGIRLHCGDVFGTVGMSFNVANLTFPFPPEFAGNTNIAWFQVATSQIRREQASSGTWYRKQGSNLCDGGVTADTSFPYPFDEVYVYPIATDTPKSDALANYIGVDYADSFDVWLMYQPNGGKWVPLQKTSWHWMAWGVGMEQIG